MNYESDLTYKIATSRIKGVGNIPAKTSFRIEVLPSQVLQKIKNNYTRYLHVDEIKQKLNWDSSKGCKTSITDGI